MVVSYAIRPRGSYGRKILSRSMTNRFKTRSNDFSSFINPKGSSRRTVTNRAVRLDQATSGLLLLTNDSALSSFLTDPAHKVMRTYLVTVRGEFTEAQATEAVVGVVDGGERLQCHTVKIQKNSGRESHLEVVLTQGKNREIRRLFKALGHEVTRLRRIQYGPFKLEDLPSGAWREIPIEDVKRSLRL